jgi:hypothetical protein
VVSRMARRHIALGPCPCPSAAYPVVRAPSPEHVMMCSTRVRWTHHPTTGAMKLGEGESEAVAHLPLSGDAALLLLDHQRRHALCLI